MSDTTGIPGESTGTNPPAHAPRHRTDEVAEDADLDLSEFGENPDTELAG